ncbi:EAL domain-containing protein [Thermus tengchongensis]|uniref:EAL domain-containing protein n=1 Tax=Thermus tengchongensis TaxID=1214928 RepID=A0A4Y9FEW9_9DEIN|nr:EAL domain-containing protein [Thermus tengchongensis]TFU27049.1 EAL domain-containing protein [Thermus tengchongensis]
MKGNWGLALSQALFPLLRRGLEGLGDALEQVALALSTHRAYLFRLEERHGVWYASQLAEWAGPGTSPQIQNPALQNLPLREAGYGRWLERFLKDQAVAGPVASFPEEEKPLLEETGCPPDRLVLEVTESSLIPDERGRDATRALEALRNLGVGIYLDDFGSGYSSLERLSTRTQRLPHRPKPKRRAHGLFGAPVVAQATTGYLAELPVQGVKLGQAFTRRLGAPPNPQGPAARLVAAVLALAQALGLEAIAEGIEDQATLAYLRNLGFPLGQGYLWGKPEPLRL